MNASTVKPHGGYRSALGHFAYWLFAILCFETILHGCVFGEFTVRYLFAVGFSIPVAAILSLLTGLLPERGTFAADVILNILLMFAYGAQLVYYFVFGSLFSIAMVALGGDAVTSFWRETLMTMVENLLPLALLFIPLILLAVLKKKARSIFLPAGMGGRLLQLGIAVAVQAAVFGCLFIGGTGYFSDHYFYHSIDTTTDQAAERFGLITAMRLELTMGDEETDESYYVEDVEPTVTPEAEKPVEYNVLEIDFDTLNGLTDNKKIQAINDYCASLPGTEKNDYTGMLKDYNLIVICGESFDTGAIHPELTPTLYRMANEGLIFNNYYNTFPNVTTNGEYSLMQGLYPDMTRGKDASSFLYSRSNYIPFALGNVFMDQREIQSYGYHNFDPTYYGRNRTHPNLGYQMKFARDGMTFTTSWPSSDLEMMEQSVDDYIGMEQFHAYYMTFSGHYKYDVDINPMARRNWDAVKDLEGYSAPTKAYLACNIELEKAMAYLMQRLEEQGVADKTAIVMAGDHFPYGLSDKEYSELVGYELDHFNKFKSSLLFWVGGLEENIVVDEYCCNVDVLPTILNLWGFDFDSRMLTGTDVFSDGEHMAVLTDKSFFTDKVWFNTNNGEIRYLVDESTLPEGYIDDLIRTVKTKFSISTDILLNNYWDFVFNKAPALLEESASSETQTTAQ